MYKRLRLYLNCEVFYGQPQVPVAIRVAERSFFFFLFHDRVFFITPCFQIQQDYVSLRIYKINIFDSFIIIS
jgi:hypothetical protein